MTRETILITGATGAVGHEVVRTLPSAPNSPRLLLLMRGGEARIAGRLARIMSWSGLRPGSRVDVVVLPGDASRHALGVSENDLSLVTRETTAILHMAASTRLDQSGPESLLNVASTRHVLETARSCGRLDRISVVSTAFVAGRSGTIRENELDFEQGFSNEYERSKAMAESECREAMSRLPIAIYRLSIVVGRREDGRLSRSGMFSAVCRLFHRRLLPFFPGDPSQALDMIPADFAARALTALIRGAFARGTTYHLCAGEARSLTLGELFESMADDFGRQDAAWRDRGLPSPIFTSSSAFGRLPDDPRGTPRLRRIGRSILGLTGSLERSKVYDTTEFDAAAAPLGLRLAHAREWIHTLVERAVPVGPSAGERIAVGA